MRFSWRLAALKNGFQDATAYRWEFVLDVLGSAIIPAAIQWVIWYAIFKIGNATQISGMTYTDLVQYTLTSTLFTQIRGGDLDFELQDMIRTGSLSNYLLRPVGVVEFVFIRGSAPKLLVALIALVLGLGFGHFWGIAPHALLAGMLLAILGNIIHYQIGSILSTAAFYWEDAYSLLMVKNLSVALLSGELLPLNLFPDNWQWVWKSTPFYLYVYGPSQLALGKWNDTQFIQSIGIAGLWILLLWALIFLSWRMGIKKYLSLGG